MKELQRHLDAFELYLKNKQNQGSVVESIRLVCSEFKVSEKTAYKWKKEFDWDGREAVRSAEIQRRVEQKTNTTIVNNKARYLSYYHKLLDKLISKDMPIDIKNPRDLDLVIKGALLLQGESTDRVENDASFDLNYDLPTDIRKAIADIGARIDEEKD